MLGLIIVLIGGVLVGIGSVSNTSGGTKTATATLIVDAQVINDNGGAAQASDFTICIFDYGGTNPEPQCFQGSETRKALYGSSAQHT